LRLGVEERRAQLVEKAIEVFSAQPFDDVSLDDVAKQLSISKGLLFHYFPSKRDFFAAAIESVAEALYQEIVRPLGETPEEAVRAGVRAYFAYAKRHRTAYVMLVRKGGGIHPAVDAVLEKTRARIVDRIVGEAEPELRARPVAKVVVRAWIAFTETMCVEWLEKRISQKQAEALIHRTLFDLVRAIDPESAAID